MKPITRKLVEAGLISEQFTSMLERWGSLSPGEVDQVRKFRKGLSQFIDELDELLDPNTDIKETKFEIIVRDKPIALYSPESGHFQAVIDELGRFIISPTVKIKSGDFLWKQDDRLDPSLIVVKTEILYEGDVAAVQQITVNTCTFSDG